MWWINDSGCSKSQFLLSWVKSAAAARGCRQAVCPWSVGSHCFDRYATGVKEGPCFCPKVPKAILCLSVAENKGVRRSENVRAGVERMACLRVSKAEWIFDFSSRGSERPPWVAWYRGCAKRAKLGIQRRRYAANPKKDRICVFDVGNGKVDIRDFLYSNLDIDIVIYLLVGVKRTLR